MKKIISGGTGEFIDKKSRFIANIYHIEDEDMAIIDTLNEDLHTSHVPEDLRDIQF